MSRARRVGVVAGVVHLALTLLCVTYSLGSTANFDAPSQPTRGGYEMAAAMASVLLLPGRLLWVSWASSNLSNRLEWSLLFANSALWGVVTAWLASCIHRRTSTVDHLSRL